MSTADLIEKRKLALRLWFFTRTDRIAWKPPGSWKRPNGQIIPVCPTNNLTEEQLDGLLRAHLDASAPAVSVPWRVEKNNNHGVEGPGHYRLGTYTPSESPPPGEDGKRGPGRTFWACFDFDGAGGTHKKPLQDVLRAALKVLDACDSVTVPAFLERSKSGTGYHIWIFFRPGIRADLARAFCLRVCPTDEPLSDGSPADPRRNLGIEVFPKSHRIEPGGMGNQVWLPWFHGADAGNNVFLRRNAEGRLEEYEPQFEAAPLDVIEVLGQEELDREALEAKQTSQKRTKRAQTHGAEDDFARACAAYRMAHWVEWPREGSPCPMCGSKDGLKASGLDGRWVCFSSSHDAVKVGWLVDRPGRQRVWQGDVVHLDAHRAGLEPREFLIREGYLTKGPRLRTAKPGEQASSGSAPSGGAGASGVSGGAGPAGAAAQVIDLDPASDLQDRPLKSGSALSVWRILAANSFRARVRCLAGKSIEFDEMAGSVCIGRERVTDLDLTNVQTDIERAFSTHDGGGLEFTRKQVEHALAQVASKNRFHPVREYLDGLKWDGVKRLDVLAQKTLDIEHPTKLVVTQIRKTLIAGVARAYSPACKVKTMLVLVGPQDAGKSAWFKALVPDIRLFSDKPLQIGNKESEFILAQVWICEWAEMSALEGKSADAVKSFISSDSSIIVPKFSNNPVEVRRSSIFVGSCNPSAILSDPTGGRRFWPIENGPNINAKLIEEKRDQLWAEAVAAYRAGEQWWLTPEESLELDAAQEPFQADTDIDPAVLQAVAAFGKRPFHMNDLIRRMSVDEDGRVKKTILDTPKLMTDRIHASLRRHGFEYRHRFRVSLGSGLGTKQIRMWSLKSMTQQELSEQMRTPQSGHYSEPEDQFDAS